MRGAIEHEDRVRLPDINLDASVRFIQTRVAEQFQIRFSDIVCADGPGGRRQEFVRPRHLAMYLCHEITRAPRRRLAKLFNRRYDVIGYAVRSIKDAMKSYPKHAARIEAFQQELKEQLERME